MVRQEDKAKIRNVKVITSEECVPKHKPLVMDMRFKATKRRRRKFEPRVRVWKFKEEKTCEDYRCSVGDKVEEAKWKGLGVRPTITKLTLSSFKCQLKTHLFQH